MSVSRDNLPRSMRYAATSVPAVQAECTLARFDSTNGVEFKPNGANEIRIRVKADGFLNASKHYLYFQVKSDSATAAFVDGDAGCFFDRVTIESNGTQVEQIDRYALWNGIRRNYNNDIPNINKLCVESGGGQMSTITGVGAFPAADTSAVGDAAANATAITGLVASVNATNTAFLGATNGLVNSVALSNLGDVIKLNQSRIYCIQLQSGCLLNTHSKALPDGINELEIVLRLRSSAGALVSTAAVNFTINAPRLYCPVYRIANSEVMSSYNQLASSGISWIGETVKTYVNSMPKTQGPQVLQLNDRSMSLKALITALRSNAPDTKLNYSNTGFFIGDSTGTIKDYLVKIAGVNYPQSQILLNTADNAQDIGRCYEESIKSLARPGEKYCNAHVDKAQFIGKTVNYATANNTGATTSAKGLLCVDLKKFSDSELRMVGLNTANNAAPSTFEITVGAEFATVIDATTFALVEAIWTMDNTGALRVAM